MMMIATITALIKIAFGFGYPQFTMETRAIVYFDFLLVFGTYER